MVVRCQGDLYYLATEVLGYDYVIKGWHRPLLAAWDERRVSWMASLASSSVPYFDLDLWPREYGKTTAGKAQVIQDLLWDPDETFIWWHAVDDRASEEVNSIAEAIQGNDLVRWMLGDRAPSKRDRKFASGGKFRLPGSKAITMRSFGAGSEATGGHARIGIVDDPIGKNDIDDQQIPKKLLWYENTVQNVIQGRDGWVRHRGTRWDEDDYYRPLIEDTSVDTIIRGSYEVAPPRGEDGEPEWDDPARPWTEPADLDADGKTWLGEPQLWTADQIEAKRRKMRLYVFSCQKQNKPAPAAMLGWKQSHEQFCDATFLRKFAGRYVVLTDPAPANNPFAAPDRVQVRKDGSKDWWSTSVWRIFYEEDVLRAALITGIRSQEWEPSEGFDKAIELCRRFGTPNFFWEQYGFGATYTEPIRAALKRHGARLSTDEKGEWRKYVDDRGAFAKNRRIETLCDWNTNGRIYICDRCPDDYLHGDGKRTGFLTQLRAWRALQKGRNNLHWDDDADCGARITDEVMNALLPQPEFLMFDVDSEDWEDDDASQRSRYCGV